MTKNFIFNIYNNQIKFKEYKMEVNAINTALNTHPNKKEIQALLNKKEYEDKNVIPSGLLEDEFFRREKTIDDLELRTTLEKAVKDANLNVTERLALNETFFPNGGGFELFPPDIHEYESTLYYVPNMPPESDTFITKALNIDTPNSVCIHKYITRKSKKPSLVVNLETALEKLKKAIC